MAAIRLLPEGLVNRIAAGEVIERPAAAVKELVENSLDAGARRIAVALQEGGILRMEVTDDGAGMAEADLALSVQRHATSKLEDDQLIRIATLGFRGEALPSIGAAARLAITSRPQGAEHAWSISVEGGATSPVRPAAGAPGTRVVVADLFFATPARRKFLKSARVEGEHAEATVRRLALAAPQVAFRLEADNAVVFDLPAQDRAARIAALLGPGEAAGLIALEESRALAEGGLLRLSGHIAAATVSRATASGQFMVVNGRPVADPVLRTALRIGYRDVIAHGRQPVAALFLDLPPEEVDVNVHPAKTELRFRDPAAVRGLLIGAVQRALARGAGNVFPAFRPARPSLRPPPLALQPQPVAATALAEPSLALALSPAARPAALPPEQRAAATPPAASKPAASAPAAEHPLGAPLAQVLDTYVLAVTADGALVLVDQHAAHERLTQEALRSQAEAGAVRSQALLLPEVVELKPAACRCLLERAAELARFGIELESFGPGALLVRALPAALGAPNPAALLRDMADELAEQGETTALAARLDAVIARLACHASIRAGQRLSLAQMDALLRQMEATPRAATCAHGRPTYLRLTRGEIESLFGRR